MTRTRRRSPLLPLLPLVALALPAFAQDGDDDVPEDLFPAQDLQQEMRQLFERVERNLVEIDTMLLDAGAGDVALEDVQDAGLDDLLRSTGDRSKQVVTDIDAILEIARQAGGGSCQQAMSGGDPGDSPLDQPRDRGPRQREDTPTEPQPGEPQEPEGGQPSEGDRPQDDQASPEPGENRPASPDDPRPGDPAPVDPDAEAWGMLPPREREIFRRTGADDLPVQYRDWIDAYYRRLNERR